MLEGPRPTRAIASAAVLGIALTLLCGLGGAVATGAAWLAQPAFALALRWCTQGDATLANWRRDALALALLWGAAALVFAVLVAWPLQALRADGGLGAAFGLSLAAGAALIVLWRQWPVWHALEREGGSLAERWRALDWFDVDAWRGLGVAALVAAVLATALLLAWPGLLTQEQRWLLASVCAV